MRTHWKIYAGEHCSILGARTLGGSGHQRSEHGKAAQPAEFEEGFGPGCFIFLADHLYPDR